MGKSVLYSDRFRCVTMLQIDICARVRFSSFFVGGRTVWTGNMYIKELQTNNFFFLYTGLKPDGHCNYFLLLAEIRSSKLGHHQQKGNTCQSYKTYCAFELLRLSSVMFRALANITLVSSYQTLCFVVSLLDFLFFFTYRFGSF
jgi:hypothetical protein